MKRLKPVTFFLQMALQLLLSALLLSSCYDYRTVLSNDAAFQKYSSGSSGQKTPPMEVWNTEERFSVPFTEMQGDWQRVKTRNLSVDDDLVDKASNSSGIILSSGLGFLQKGSKSTFPGGKFTTTLNYLEVPATVRYMSITDKDAKWSAGLGPYFSYAVGGHYKSTVNGQTTKGKVFTSASSYKHFDAGLAAGGEYMFPAGLVLALDYDYGLVNIGSTNGISTRNRVVSFSVGYSTDKLFHLLSRKK